MDPIIKKATEFADGMLDLISWMGNRMESKKKLATAEDVIGQNAEVTIPIKKGQTGEVVVVFENTRLTYGARGADSDVEFHKGEIAVIKRTASSLVYVEKRKDSSDKKNELSESAERHAESLTTASATKSGSNTNGSSAGSSASGGSKKKSKKENTEMLEEKHTEGHS